MQSKQMVGPLKGLFEYIRIPLCPQRGQISVLKLIIGWIAPFEDLKFIFPSIIINIVDAMVVLQISLIRAFGSVNFFDLNEIFIDFLKVFYYI